MKETANRDRAKPFSIRLTTNERAELQTRSGGLPVGFYVKQVLFARPGEVVRQPKAVLADHVLLARVLAGLGASRLSQNLNQLAKAANIGILPVTPETEVDLRTACEAITEMRTLLLAALGVQRQDDKDQTALRDVFAQKSAEPSA